MSILIKPLMFQYVSMGLSSKNSLKKQNVCLHFREKVSN